MMIKNMLLLSLVFVNILSAVNINVSKDIFNSNEEIVVNFSEMTAKHDDWIGIYKEEDSNTWANVLRWNWTGDIDSGELSFDALPVGSYEVRAFYNNSYQVEASKKFTVEIGNLKPATIETSKKIYSEGEKITANFNNMLGDADDWIAIYPAGSSNAWENVIQWDWTYRKIKGTHTFKSLPIGDYEVRAFFLNSFKLEANYSFSVKNTAFDLKSQKASYDPFELIYAEFENMRGHGSDWIGIFNIGAPHDKEAAIQWRYAKSLVNGTVSFNGLPTGNYELRGYFATKFKKSVPITVNAAEPITILYEDAEDGIDPRWVDYEGKASQLLNVGAQGSKHSIRHYAYSGHYLDFGDVDRKMKFLDLDMRIGVSSHVFTFGVAIKTKKGNRRIVFASWMNHSNGHGGNDLSGNAIPREPFTNDGYLHVHPGPTDYYLDTRDGSFVHYHINIEEKLRMLEPDNELLEIYLFTTSGGDYDNISLSSQ